MRGVRERLWVESMVVHHRRSSASQVVGQVVGGGGCVSEVTMGSEGGGGSLLISSRVMVTVCLKWWMERWNAGEGKKESVLSFQFEKLERHWRRR